MPLSNFVLIGPNTGLKLPGKSSTFRLGLIAIDIDQNFWAITSRRHLFDISNSQILTRESKPFGFYSETDNHLVPSGNIGNMLARIRIDDDVIKHARFSTSKTWPRTAVSPKHCLGASVHSPVGLKELGIISETDISAEIDTSAGIQCFKGAHKAQLVSQSFIKKGTAGALYINVEGEALGIAVAYQNEQVLVSPLWNYLEMYDLSPWSPIFSYWNNIKPRLPFLHSQLTNSAESFNHALELVMGRS